ncbi:tyrosine-type recombinase/integrase [Arthrobacter sp. NicSoilC12]|uniref:tyrosine-type recombinase/integrase n=1 Tax=Arthrobacter sp. NicSoilC12 TaxID=2831001 RepID=UPI001CC7D1CE|nr:tyrosine-type recombinase/integrase [Arthrobacter sp. NicSoilC12]GIU56882.1 integrase [Arthrobacter sp. NicSoilC12]GIU58016.1 integrase [Arthrobacter sp. NicSoilC12]
MSVSAAPANWCDFGVVDAAGDAGAHRPVESVSVAELGRVVTMAGVPGYRILEPLGEEFVPATEWFRNLIACDRSQLTIRTYANSLLIYLRFLWSVGRPWLEACERDTQEFVLWMRSADKFLGSKRPPESRPGVNGVTGKSNLGPKYSASAINGALTAGRGFYEFHRRGSGPVLVNPFPRLNPRLNAHHNPLEPYRTGPRDAYRQKAVRRVPRAIPDSRFEALFRSLHCNRDRALLAFYVTSGARASEILGLRGGDIDWGDSLITIRAKGGMVRQIPVGGHALIWLRLYLLERGPAAVDEGLWVTEREPRQPLGYDAFRAVLRRANDALGSNWTLHDLRHTFAIRALDAGMMPHHVQEILGHASLETLTVYSKPRIEDVLAAHRAILTPPASDATPAQALRYAQEDLEILWGRRDD